MTYRGDHGKLRLWRSCKTSFRRGGQGSKNPAPLGAGSSIVYTYVPLSFDNTNRMHSCNFLY
ncbi:MAG: hypothetical protein GF311_08125 [Candidatus Lokiarchaeota archaeon]|nr:hypothetical protein [Candidatus Lokiarchaeota archaeon]